MSKSLNSPTARLLQSSRLFSLPRPLPQPALETATSTGVYRASDSATLPYPTYQAIATPASSHFSGDWGLKRPLPAKSTKSSTPHIRVKAQDNFAHITDFESAADHTQTEAKWRQMGIPMMVKETGQSYTNPTKALYSAYDDHVDNTDSEAVHAGITSEEAQRRARRGGSEAVQWKKWKYDSPWIAGMQPGEFDIYVRSQLKSRRGEFRDFMIKRLLRQRVQDEERKLRDLGQRGALPTSRRDEILQDIVANYEAEEKRLRDDHVFGHLSSELTAAICDFLGLPDVRESEAKQVATTQLLRNQLDALTTESGPLSTHPGAGLSHIRSNAIMENHPFWGPQAYGSPVLARVLRPRISSNATDHSAKLGVGGFVANDIGGRGAWKAGAKPVNAEDMPTEQHYLEPDRMTNQIDPDLPGGNKIWVRPEMATVDSQGYIRLQIGRADNEAIAVSTNDVEDIHQAKMAAMRPTPGMMSSRGAARNANYGLSTPGTSYGRPRSHIQGFDSALNKRPQERNEQDRSAIWKIQELADYGRSQR